MKLYVLPAFILSAILSIQAQNNSDSTNNSESYSIIRSNVGMAGSSKTITTDKGNYIVSQSIGQSSVIGTSFNKGYHLSQGYQQFPLEIKIINEPSIKNLNAAIYPNPFEQSVNISFIDAVLNEISVVVFDIHGRLIFSQKFQPSQNIQLNLGNISMGTYLLKATTNGKQFNAKLIKK